MTTTHNDQENEMATETFGHEASNYERRVSARRAFA